MRSHSLLEQVQWKDLVQLGRTDVVSELFISLPWLIVSFIFASLQWYVLALFCSFMFFLTGLRQVHNAFHFALGISRPATHWVMFFLSIGHARLDACCTN